MTNSTGITASVKNFFSNVFVADEGPAVIWIGVLILIALWPVAFLADNPVTANGAKPLA